VPIGQRVSWYAIAKVGYTYRDAEGPPQLDFSNGLPALSPFEPTRNWIHFGLFLPFVYQLNEHVGLGFGPEIAIDWPPADYYSIDVRLGMSTWIPISI
jgi:hypothetical protein